MRKIMIVEDESEIRSVIHGFVAAYFEDAETPCEIEALGDTMEALFRLSDEERHYDAVLLDVRMPGLGGDDIYQALEAMEGERTRRVLFITGFSEDLLHRYGGRALHVLGKPFTYEEFSEKMDMILQHD